MVYCSVNLRPSSQASAPSPSGQPQKAMKDSEVLLESRWGPIGGVGESARRLFRHTALQGIPMLLTCSTIGCPSRTVLLYGPLRSHVLPDLSWIRLLARRSVY